MLHQIKAQLNASIEKIDRQTKIENLCSKLSATLAMAAALDSVESDSPSHFDFLYSSVEERVMNMVTMIENYEKEEEPTE